MKPVGTRTIHTERLVLRAPEMGDAEALVRIRSLAMPLKEGFKAAAEMAAEAAKPFGFHWVILRQGVVIGRIKAWEVNPYNGYLQLGYDMGEEFRNQGYMTEAVQAVVRYMLTEADANRVYCSIRTGNAASRRVCEKCGMTHEGTLRQHYARQDGGYEDVMIYGILKCDLQKEEKHGAGF